MTTAGIGPGLKGRRVFISYCSQESVSDTSDKKTADMICSELESRNIPCWIAPRDILPGDDWLNSIFDALEAAKVVIVVFSANTEGSNWVQDEIKYALDKKIKVIPFRIENVEPKGTLRILKVRCQWMDAFTHPLEKHLNRLVEVVGQHLGMAVQSAVEKDGKYEAINDKAADNIPIREEKPPRVFICYATEDKEFAAFLYEKLKNAGIEPWLDKENLRGSDRWDEEIQRVIKREIDYFLVLQSKAMQKKVVGFVNKEIYTALEREKAFRRDIRFIIPLKIGDCEILEGLEVFQTIPIDSQDNITALVRLIERDFKKRVN